MKAIIIDDEKHVREGLLLLAEWEKHGIHTILEAEDVDQAIEMIKEHRPEIIFTDMRMPRRDGISLLKWLHSSDIRSKTIVVSGHDDFEYMRNALFYKSFDYILKPIDPEILNLTLAKAVEEWNEYVHSRKTRVEEGQVLNEVKPLYWDRLFSSLCLAGAIQAGTEEKIKKEYGISVGEREKRMTLIPVKPFIDNAFQGDRELAFFTLSNIYNELLKKNEAGVCFRNINNEEELVILLWNERDPARLLEEAHSITFQYCRIQPVIALGEKSSNIKTAYESSQLVLRKHNLLHPKKISTHQDIVKKPLLHLLDHSNELKLSIRSGSAEQVGEQLNKLFTLLKEDFVLSFEQLRAWETQFELLKNNWLKEYEINSEESSYRSSDYWKEDGTFSFEKFTNEKRKEFIELIKILSNAGYQKEKNSVQKIEEYLQHHYQEDITLQDIADRFFLSREYISRKFKQEYGKTLTDYLTDIRIENAKKLLENPYLKIYEVAYSAGYQNEKYFSKVFKKHEGCTPNEYRQAFLAKS